MSTLHRYHHWDGGLAVLGFGADLVWTLVSMATKRSLRHIMGKLLSGQYRPFLIKSLSNLQLKSTGIKSPTCSILAQFWLLAWELPHLEPLSWGPHRLEGPIGKCCPDDSYFIFIRPFEKRDLLCYGVWRPSVRKLFRFRLTPPTVYIRSSWNLVYN